MRKMRTSEAKTPDEIALFIDNFNIQKEIMIEDIGGISPEKFDVPNVSRPIQRFNRLSKPTTQPITFESIKNKILQHKLNNKLQGKDEYNNINIFYDHIFDAVNGGDIVEQEAEELIHMLSPEGSKL